VKIRAATQSIIVGLIFFVIMFPIRLRTTLYHDEIFDVKPIKQLSLGCEFVDPTPNTYLLFDCIPLWSSNGYQGTLRSLLLLPLIEFDQLKPVTVLFFNSILIGFTFFYLNRLAEELKTFLILKIFFLMTIFSLPLFWTLFTFDLGPVTTQVLLRTLILLSAGLDLKKGRLLGLRTTLFCILLIWGKLDGLWFVIGILLARIIYFKKIPWTKLNIPNLITLSLFVLIGAKFALNAAQYLPTTNRFDLSSKIFNQIPRDLSNGVLGIVISDYKPVSSLASTPILILTMLSLFSFMFRENIKGSFNFQFYRVVRMNFLITLSILILLPQATAPWHTVSIIPALQLNLLLWMSVLFGNLQIDKMFLLLKKIVISIGSVMILTTSLMSASQLKALNTEEINPLYSKNLIHAFDQISPATEDSRAWVFTSWGLYNPFIMDNSFQRNLTITDVYDFWNPFEIADELERSNYLKWAISKGPLGEYQNFTFVEYKVNRSSGNSDFYASLGSNGELIHLINEFSLCDLETNEYPINDSEAFLVTIHASRCSKI